jgi:type I restriction enzyme, S subunit
MTELPNGWEIKPLEDLCEPGKQAIVDGPFGSNLKRSDYVDSGIPVLKIQNIKENIITLKKMDYVKPEKYEELVRHSFTEGDIVMTKLGDPLGVSAIVNGIPNGLIVADLVRIRPSKVLTKFLCYQLNSPRIQKYINEQQKGTTRPRVNLAMIRELPIYTPPIDEQHKIVELLEDHLSRLEAALVDVKQAKIKAAQFRRSLLQTAFSGKFIQESGSGDANWAISELGELCTFITDGSHNPPKGIEKSEYLMLSSRDINNGELTFDKPRYLSKKDFDSENKRTDLQIDDVLLTTVGTIGRTAIYSGVPKNVTFQRSVSVLRPNKEKISSKFLMYFLDSLTDLLNREARGVAQQGIYLNQVRKLEISVPSLEEQLFLVELLDDHLARLDSSCKLADLMENQGSALRRSLLQAAFTGQLTKEVVSV